MLLQDCFQNSHNLVYLEQSEILLCGTTEVFSKGRGRNVCLPVPSLKFGAY